MKLRESYSRLSIRYKILISFYAVILIITLSLGYYAYSTARQSVMDRVGTANLEIARKISSNLDFLQKDLMGISLSLGVDPAVQTILNSTGSTLNQEYGYLNSADVLVGNSLKTITNLVASKSYPIDIVLYANNTDFTPFHITNDATAKVKSFADIMHLEEYEAALAAKGGSVWYMQEQAGQFYTRTKPSIAIGKVIKDLTTLKAIGFLLISVNEELIRHTSSRGLQLDNGSIAVLNSEGQVLSYAGTDLLKARLGAPFPEQAEGQAGDGYSFDETERGEMLVAYSGDNMQGWHVHYAVLTDTLIQQVNSIRTFTVIVVLGCIMLSLPIVLWILSSLTTPIYALLSSMKRFQKGNFEEQLTIVNRDEMGELTRGYNRMIMEIKELIDRAYVSQIKEKEAELNILQAQINPHFLYNTLDMILMKAERSKETEIADMIYSLSRLFRLSLNRGNTYTLLANEKEFIEHYLLLQKVRFKSRLDYELSIDDRLLAVSVPKLILQPFVENAIVHGVEGMKSDGFVSIRGLIDGDDMKLIVEDNGSGMEPEKLERLLSEDGGERLPESAAQTGGFAIRNVNQRLKLAYKEGYTLTFATAPGKGTRVEITIHGILYPGGKNYA